MKKVSPGIQLAKELIRVDEKIKKMIKKQEFNFDVWEENGKGFIATAICNVGGCTVSKVEYQSFEEAKQEAAIMTLAGKKPEIIGICNECRNSGDDETICPICGGELWPMYDQFPNWIKFCPTCH